MPLAKAGSLFVDECVNPGHFELTVNRVNPMRSVTKINIKILDLVAGQLPAHGEDSAPLLSPLSGLPGGGGAHF